MLVSNLELTRISVTGSVVLEFGPFVVCALEHTLRVVRSDSKSLTQSQRSAITLYVAGVLSDLLRMQVFIITYCSFYFTKHLFLVLTALENKTHLH